VSNERNTGGLIGALMLDDDLIEEDDEAEVEDFEAESEANVESPRSSSCCLFPYEKIFKR